MGGDATAYDATRALWDTYHPWVIWLILGVIGLVSLVGMMWNYQRSASKA